MGEFNIPADRVVSSSALKDLFSAAGVQFVLSGGEPKLMEIEHPISVRGAALQGVVRMGQYSYIGRSSEIRDCNLGRFCSIARRVCIGLAEHPMDRLTSHPIAHGQVTGFEKDPYLKSLKVSDGGASKLGIVEVGHDVWIGDGAFIRQGVKVGTGAVIAARAVVTRDVPPYTIVSGVPARGTRHRFAAEMVQRLLASEWWEFDLSSFVKQGVRFDEIEKILSELELGNVPRRDIPKYRMSWQGKEVSIEGIDA